MVADARRDAIAEPEGECEADGDGVPLVDTVPSTDGERVLLAAVVADAHRDAIAETEGEREADGDGVPLTVTSAVATVSVAVAVAEVSREALDESVGRSDWDGVLLASAAPV